MNAPLPPNETARIAALRRYDILDTPPELAFDRITHLAARLFKTPVAFVTLVDESRQCFKSTHGLDIREISREFSFCSHAILSDGLTVVQDTTQDRRFSDNPLVIGAPHVRFYAGAPLKSSDNFILGTLCILDLEPRTLDAGELATLSDLAAIVSDEIELRLAIRERSQQAVAIANLGSGVLVADPSKEDCPITFSNPGFSLMTGYNAEEILGRNCRFLQGPDTDREEVAAMREAIQARRTYRGVLLNYRKDGTPFWNDLIIDPVFDDKGEVVNLVGLQMDVTGAKRAADQLRASFEQLQKLETLRDNLTTMIIHDLRSPLTSVIGFLDLLSSAAEEKLDGKELEYIGTARKSAGILREMITSLLDVTRLEAGEMPLNRQPNDITGIVMRAAAEFSSLVGNRSFILDLPDCASARCDADLIRRVVENLLNNAFKFTSREGEVRIIVREEGGDLRIAVSDTGLGIPREQHERMFEKFSQMESNRGRHSTGLGLAFCKLAVEAHGGRIGVESEPGKGSTFWLMLPRES